MKRIISLFLTITMIASLIVAIPAGNVTAAETITDEALFMTYPTYLSNSEMDEGLQKAEAAYYAVINSYSDSDETVATLMSSMSEGISILIKESLANLNVGETLYETQVKKAATGFMQSMFSNENVIKKASDIVGKAYETLNDSYSVAQSIDKTTMMVDLMNIAKENDISITPDDMDDIVNSLYDSGTLEKDLKAIGYAQDMWKVVFELTQIHAIEKTTLNFILDELERTNQTYSDLYIGLSMLKDDIDKDPFAYLSKYYLTETAIGFLAEQADELLGFFTSGNAVLLVNSFMKLFADYIYVNAKAEDIIQVIMNTSFVSSMDICLSQYRLKFLKSTGTVEDIKAYESLYGAYLAAHRATLDACYDVAKITDKFSLGGDCMIWSSNIETLYTYNKYIEWCKEEVAHDISNSEIDKTTGSSTITDALNEETIADRIERVLKLYPAGSKWAGDFGGTKSSLGYAGKVFNHIFDKTMGRKVENDYQYILTSNANVRLIGRLEEEGVTETALKELFANVRIGDVLITSGQYDYLHAMTVVGMVENGPIVYDVDSKYGPAQTAEEYTHLIQQYEFPYSKMADAFSFNGKYLTKPGISVYRAIRKVNSTNSGTSLSNEEYDDSVNYVIENGVLSEYKGSRTAIVIPDGVTEIADNCFNGNNNIQSVYMPDSVQTIGEYAFYTCKKLDEIRFSPNLTIIKSNAFFGCSALRSIVIAGSPEIESEAFRCCSSLQTILLDDRVLKIGTLVFYDTKWYYNSQCDNGDIYLDHILIKATCSKDNSLIIKEGTKAIAENALNISNYCESLYIPESLEYWNVLGTDLNNITTIYYNAVQCEFSKGSYSASNVINLYIGENVSKIGQYNLYSFNNVKNLYYNAINCTCFKWNDSDLSNVSNIIIGDKVQSIPDNAFAGTSIITIKIPESVTKINNAAFSTTNLSSVTIPDTVTELGHSVFNNCFSLSNVTLSDSITYIGPNSFANSNISSLSIPASVKNIDTSAFYNTSISEFIVDERNENYSAVNGVLYNKSGDTLEIFPQGLFSLNIPKECKHIKPYAFDNVRYLSTIKVEDGNTSFKVSADALYSIDMKKLVRWIYNMSNPVITVPEGVKTIYSNAFNTINYMNEIYLPASLEAIGYNAFYNCKRLNNVYYNASKSKWDAIETDSKGNEKLFDSKTHYYYYAKTEISALTADNTGKVSLTTINVPDNAVVYVASYNNINKLLELKKLALNNGDAYAIFSTSGVYKYKAFIWECDTLIPISAPKEYILK